MTETVRKKKPIAGGLWGLSLGLGLGLLAINGKLIDLKIAPFVMVALLGVVIGVLWGMYGPAKKPKGPEPVSTPAPVGQPAVAEEPSTPEPVAASPVTTEDPLGDAPAAPDADVTEPDEPTGS